MVKVRDDHPVTKDGIVDMESWLARIHQATGNLSTNMLNSAAIFAAKLGCESSSSYNSSSPLKIGMEMVDILVKLQLEPESLVAALLYRLVREGRMSIDLVELHFGVTVKNLVHGVLGMAAINAVQVYDHNQLVLGEQNDNFQLEKIRKMLVSIINDVRVALIKIAERNCVIRIAKKENEQKRKRIAQEVFAIYAPLAHRLGIGYIKWELEDLAFSYLNSGAYKQIANLLDEKRIDREKQLNQSNSMLVQKLKSVGIEAEVQGRVKHIYSIWKKMQKKSIEFHDLYDIQALRILVNKVQNCYEALGVVHSLWHHIPREFDDYITTPKENGYQSLHTAVIGPQGKTLEVQIRTYSMHEDAEFGVCSHWSYKGTDTRNKSINYEQKLSWLRQVLDWHEEVGLDINSFADQWRGDAELDRVYVFTKDGHIIDLPTGSTPVDFAYRVHTEIGHQCCGAKIGGRIVPLSYTLQTGDQVSILTAKNSTPSRDWINPDMGYTKTPRARAKVINWFRKQDCEINLKAGRQMIESELKKLALKNINYEKLAKAVNQNSVDNLFTACGSGDIRLSYIIRLAQKQLERSEKEYIHTKSLSHDYKKMTGTDISIEGVGNLLTSIAECCHPVPGDNIAGYLTLNRGVTIHRSDCSNVLILCEQEPHRILAVQWNNDLKSGAYPIPIVIHAYHRKNLLSEIVISLASQNINLLDINTQYLKKENQSIIKCKIEVNDIDQLSSILSKIIRIPNVISASRRELSPKISKTKKLDAMIHLN